MPVIEKEKVSLQPESELISKSLHESLETALQTKEQALKMNAFLENQLYNARNEIVRLNDEINDISREKKQLEKFNDFLLRLVCYLCERELQK